MISKFPGCEIARSSGTTIGCGKRSFIIDTSAHQEGSRSRGFGIGVRLDTRDRRRALTIAGRRDWNWESSGQPRPHRLESRNTGYKLGNRFLPGIYIVNVSPSVTRSFRRNNEVFPGKNWVARVRVPFLSSTPLFRSILLSDCTDVIAVSAHLNRVGERNIPRASKQILHQLTGVDLNPTRTSSIRRSIRQWVYGSTFRVNERGRARPTVLQKDIYYSNKDIS